MQDLKEFLIKKQKHVMLLATINLVALISIGQVNFPYIDDSYRRYNRIPNFAEHYSRWGSELMSWLVQGSRRLSDLGLVTFILTAVILTLSSIIIIYVLVGEKANYFTFILSSLVGINPWILNGVAYRFDGPYISMSILMAVFPFLYWKQTHLRFAISTTISVFLLNNFYQASNGIYAVMLLSILLIEFLNNNEKIKTLLVRTAYSVVSFGLAIGLYLIQLVFLPAVENARTELVEENIFFTVVRNIEVYVDILLRHSPRIWIVSYVLLLIVFVIFLFVTSNRKKTITLLSIGLYWILSFVSSYSIFLFKKHSISGAEPRYVFMFATWAAVIAIICSTRVKKPFVNIFKTLGLLPFAYYMISFVFVFSAMLSIQKDTFVTQSTLLASDLMEIYEVGDQILVNGRMFGSSRTLYNATANFPILDDLVHNHGCRQFPNRHWFSEVTGLPVPFDMYVPSFYNLNHYSVELVLSNHRWDIYRYEHQIFIFIKEKR